MFKKFKDKLAEEVKSSPQRIQQFAQAAQAAVTSASSSISDITNNDLFSIGDNDNHRGPVSAVKQPSTFQEISLAQQQSLHSASDGQDTLIHYDETPRQRRLSNSSFSSDTSFRLPTYESPSMYHIQSDMDVSASEAEEKGFGPGGVNLDRVTKEELYFAYRRTRDRWTKYKNQYADLARHYKLLERENAKARNVLVETQDKALRRISELKEQCSLEQSAKAHLERALRVEIEEKNMKIETLNTKVKFLQENKDNDSNTFESVATEKLEKDNSQLIDLRTDDKSENVKQESEITILSNKITKMEQLINKYKESLKLSKEKNVQVNTELQVLSTELENKNRENEFLKSTNASLIKAEEKIEELNDVIEKLQNSQTILEFTKNKEISVLKLDLEQAQEEITQLNSRIIGLSKREEEYAISLAENKLSIHKELETKEAEIKSLKDSLSKSQNEVQVLSINVSDYKKNLSILEEEQKKLHESINELTLAKTKVKEQEIHINDLTKKIHIIENSKVKLDEEYKCLELQLKQETAEKLAMLDRNAYLENRNTQLSEDCLKKSSQINNLEIELRTINKNSLSTDSESEKKIEIEEINKWKTRYINLESEIQEERDELVKLQTEIEKLLCNHESAQAQNTQLHMEVLELETRNNTLKEKIEKIKTFCVTLLKMVRTVQQNVKNAKQETKILLQDINNQMKEMVTERFSYISTITSEQANEKNIDVKNVVDAYEKTKEELQILKQQNENLTIQLQQEKAKHDETNMKINNNCVEYNSLLEELKNIKKEKQDICENIKYLDDENLKLKEKVQNYGEIFNNINEDNKKLMQKLKLYEELKAKVEKENEYLLKINKEVEDENNKLSIEIKTLLNKLDDSQVHMDQIKTENEKLITDIKHFEALNFEMKNEHHNFIEKIKETELKNNKTESEERILRQTLTETQNAQVSIESENKNLQHNLNALKSEYSKLVIENQELNCKLKDVTEQKSALDAESETILTDLNKYKDSNITLQKEVLMLKKQSENDCKVLETMESENIELKKKIENFNTSIEYTQDLEAKIKALQFENINLKSQGESISDSIKQLELEMLQVRNSHNEIEKEKDHLNSIISNLESNEHNLNCSSICTNEQTPSSDNNFQENALENLQLNENSDNKFLERDNMALKEENKRLQSDIEGLQNYLAKISKENSDLNERLREVISSNDHFSEQTEMSNYDIHALKNEIQSGKDKIDSLTRENMLLVEENLELKDQIHIHSNDDEKKTDFNRKYNSILEVKNNLEKRVEELENTNWSINTNMQEMQVNNEKLRLSNDKLGRRLDEALVSLRHLHSLQENTELEYLRNILYEYLTGSGTHSLTLAKVLSAVVKFNDTQTELVLQKEKERQGLLRQLGIII